MKKLCMHNWIESFAGRTRMVMPVWRGDHMCDCASYVTLMWIYRYGDDVVLRCKGLQDARKCDKRAAISANWQGHQLFKDHEAITRPRSMVGRDNETERMIMNIEECHVVVSAFPACGRL